MVVAAVLKVVFRFFAPVQTAFPQGHVAAFKGRDLMLRITLKQCDFATQVLAMDTRQKPQAWVRIGGGTRDVDGHGRCHAKGAVDELQGVGGDIEVIVHIHVTDTGIEPVRPVLTEGGVVKTDRVGCPDVTGRLDVATIVLLNGAVVNAHQGEGEFTAFPQTRLSGVISGAYLPDDIARAALLDAAGKIGGNLAIKVPGPGETIGNIVVSGQIFGRNTGDVQDRSISGGCGLICRPGIGGGSEDVGAEEEKHSSGAGKQRHGPPFD